jgi:hypothetical protein
MYVKIVETRRNTVSVSACRQDNVGRTYSLKAPDDGILTQVLCFWALSGILCVVATLSVLGG